MRIARVVLQNVKSYGQATAIDLTPGINAVCGENGSGKSTILEAIGFALFGYRPYRLDAFLREGEKSGSITVTVENDDGCLFHVVRKLGAGSSQTVYDELEQRIAEGEADVRKWRLDFFGLEPDSELEELFKDTIGPPQGTLTSIFLESAAPRKEKFDHLLKITDYRDAVDALREVRGIFDRQATDADRRAALLEGDARRLPEVEQRQSGLTRRLAELGVGLADLASRQAELGAARERAERAREAVQRAEADLAVAANRAQGACRWLEERAAELRRAEEVARLVESCRAGYQAYHEAGERMRRLEARRTERDRLQREAEAAGRNALQWEMKVRAAEEKLAALEVDETRALELELLAPEQERRELAVTQAEGRVRALEEATRRAPAVEERLKAARASLQEAEGRLLEVESAGPLAARLGELRELDRGLRAELGLLEQQAWELKQTRDARAAGEGRLGQLERELRGRRDEAERLRLLEPLAALAAARQRERDAFHGEVRVLEARHQESLRSRRQVEGGLCPFLHEPCRNLRPGVSLDAHFDGLAARTSAELRDAQAHLARAEQELEKALAAGKEVSRLPDLAGQVELLAGERVKLLQEIDGLARRIEELAGAPEERIRHQEALARLEPELARAEAASRVVAGAPGWRGQAEVAAETVRVEEKALAEIRGVLEREADARETLAAARDALREMKDPRGEAALLRQKVARERPEASRVLGRARRDAAAAREVEERARRALEPYAGLAEEIEAVGKLRRDNEAAGLAFLRNQAEAETVPKRREAHQRAASEAEGADVALEAARGVLEGARAAHDESEHLRLRAAMEDVADQIARGQKELELYRQEEQRNLAELAELRRSRAKMEATQREATGCRRLRDAVVAVQDALKRAGPEIAREMLRRISARATGIYRDLLGDPAVYLEWGSDYEIRSRVGAEEREFKQLSGGEQMAAALAVRLALLQTVSNLRLAFLDEPTAHMDTARRVNLAAQIQNLRSFDQLVVISHDDSFDTLFGHVVRLAKRNGVTVVER